MSATSIINDIVFKAVFAKEENKYLLICLLNALLDMQNTDRITDITILNPFIEGDYIDDKVIVLDIKAKDGQGRLYNIEMQINPPKNYINRAILYLSRLFSEQIGKGEDYKKLPKTIGISIIDSKILFKNSDEIHNVFRFKNIGTGEELTDILELHFIELDKFEKEKSFELSNRFEKWLYLLKFGDYYRDYENKLPKELEEEEGIPMAIDSYQRTLANERFRIKLIEMDMARMDRNNFIAEARDEGLEQGIQQGMQQGMQRGIEESIFKLNGKGFSAEKISEMLELQLTYVMDVISKRK